MRERLTELGIDFVARHVEPWPEQRAELAALVAEPSIPVLQTDDGQVFAGPEEIFGYLDGLPEGECDVRASRALSRARGPSGASS